MDKHDNRIVRKEIVEYHIKNDREEIFYPHNEFLDISQCSNNIYANIHPASVSVKTCLKKSLDINNEIKTIDSASETFNKIRAKYANLKELCKLQQELINKLQSNN